MKTKRFLTLLISAVLVLAVVSSTFIAGAATFDKDALELKPGNLQFVSSEYSMAWLDKLIIRDDVNAITTSRIVPKADYPYSTTYEQFIEEVNARSFVTVLNENTLDTALNSMLKYFYYAAVAMDMVDDYDTMVKYLQNKGIRVPLEVKAEQKIEVAVVYAALKYNAVYALYGRNVELAKGTTLDEASAAIIAAVGGVTIPSKVRSLGGLSAYFMEGYISELDEIPLTDNPGIDELFYWVRAVTAAKNDYLVPMISFDQTTPIQRDYVDYAYYASVLSTFYDVHIDPLALAKADDENDTAAIPKLILKTMLKEKGIKYNDNAAGENLFDLACVAGCFPLEEEFFSDIYDYDLYVSKDCEKLWFTPFAMAEQLGGSNDKIRVNIGDKEIKAASTTFAPLNPNKSNEKVKVTVTYDEGHPNPTQAVYNFNVIKVKDTKTVSENQNSVVSDVEYQIKKVLPEGSSKSNQAVDSIFEGVNKVASQVVVETKKPEEKTTAPEEKDPAIIETYPTAEKPDSETKSDFSYLNDLFNETYALDGDAVYTTEQAAEKSGDGALQKTVQAVKENPEIVAVPTGAVTGGVLVGYVFSKKKKTVKLADEKIEEDTTNGSDE